MSQTAVETPAAVALNEYFGLESDDSDESVVESPERLRNDDKFIADVPDCRSSKSSSGVSESSFSSPETNEIVTVKLQRPQRPRPPATRISLSDKNNFEISPMGPFLTEEELVGGDDFLDGTIDLEDEARLLNESSDEKTEMVDDDLGFHEVSPRKREHVSDGQSDSSMGVSPKRLRLDTVDTVETPQTPKEEEVEDPRDSSARSDDSEGGLSSFIVLREEEPKMMMMHEVVGEEVVSYHSVYDEEEEEGSFDVAGVEWNFSSRSAEYLTSAVFVNDIYRVICARENGSEPETFEERPEDIDNSLRNQFIEQLLSRRDKLKLTLTSVHLSLRLLDNFIHDHACDRKAFVGVCVVAVVLASKMEEYDSCKFSEVARVIFPFEDEMDVTTLKNLEQAFYSVLDCNIDTPTAFLVANILHTTVVSTKQQVHLANYLLELSMLDWSVSQHRPTVLAHAVVSLSHAIAWEEMGSATGYHSGVDALVSVERRISHFSQMGISRSIASRLLQLFERAPEDAVSIYDRYSTENELYVAFFEVGDSLKLALANGETTDQ